MKITASILTIVLLPLTARSQYSIKEMEEWRVRTTKNHMLILGGWAVANIGTGIYGSLNASGSTRYFHQMNVGWNAVNLSIATFGYFMNKPSSDVNAYQLTKSLIGIENSLMLNTGLDFAYITSGVAMRALGIRGDYNNPERLIGFGTSLILQGAFLAAFDIYQFLVYQKRRNRFLGNQLIDIEVVTISNGLAIRF